MRAKAQKVAKGKNVIRLKRKQSGSQDTRNRKIKTRESTVKIKDL